MKPITQEYRLERMYKWMRLATKLHNEKMGINANSPRTLRIKAIAAKARKYYQDNMPVQTKKKRSKTSRNS